MYLRNLNNFFIKASINVTRRICLNNRLQCCDDFIKINKFKPLQQKYKKFDDKDSEIIYDDLDTLLNQKQERNKVIENIPSLARGKTGVFDLEEMINLLREEKLKDIIVIKVPKALQYCDFMIICTALSEKHLNIYKLKKNPEDKFLSLKDTNLKWRLIDLDNLILNIFTEKTRIFYDMETLWAIGEEYDDHIQKPQENIVQEILNKHFFTE